MKKIEAKIVCDNIDPRGNRITTMLLTFPRFILAELNTHRMFSKNSASSRAIPFEKILKMVEEDPFIPIAWQKDHSGMQGTEYWTEPYEIGEKIKCWLNARDSAISHATYLNSKGGEGITKQLCNRILEPFLWHTVLLTSTEFENFFKQRCPKYEIYAGPEDTPEYFCSGRSWEDFMKSNNGLAGDFNTENIVERLQYSKSGAEIHMQILAESIWDAMNESTPKLLQNGEFHIPFGDNFDGNEILKLGCDNNDIISDFIVSNEVKISTARCARLSYNTFDGEINYQKDIELHDKLLNDEHWSPFEHCARTMSNKEYANFSKTSLSNLDNRVIDIGWVNNFRGFIQYRYMLQNKLAV